MIVGKEIGYETYLFKIRKLLENASWNLEFMLSLGIEFFAIGMLGDCGGEEFVYFDDFRTARDYYLLVDRSYKVLYSFDADGVRRRMTKEDMIRKPFDYAAPIKDIRRVPCKKLVVGDTEAFAHFTDCVYCYKYNDKRKLWKLIEIKNEYCTA